METLPLEVVNMVVDSDDIFSKADFLALRILNKTFCSLVTPRAFRVHVVHNDVKSLDALTSLSESELAGAVEEIVFDDPKWFEVDNYEGKEERTRIREEAATRAFSRLHKFPSLTTLQLLLPPHWEEEESFEIPEELSESTRLQLAVIDAVASNSQLLSLRSLTLSNIVAFQNTVYDGKPFQDLLSPLRHLSVRILTDTALEGSYSQEPLNDFWYRTIPSRFLMAPQSSLTSLTLQSDQYLGFIDTPPIHFPRLCSLCISSIIFEYAADPQFGMEAFIIRHKETLQRLKLDDCPILSGDEGGSDRVWADIWERFEEELGNLNELTVLRGKGRDDIAMGDSDSRDTRMGYVYLNVGFGFIPNYEDIPGEDRDDPALQRLKSVLEARKG